MDVTGVTREFKETWPRPVTVEAILFLDPHGPCDRQYEGDEGFMVYCCGRYVYIPVIMGRLKPLVTRAVRDCGNNLVLFTSVVSFDLVKALAKKRENIIAVAEQEPGVYMILVRWEP